MAQIVNYDGYFSGDHASAYMWDVGSRSTRNLIMSEVGNRRDILEIGSGISPVYSDSLKMDVQGNPDYLCSISDDIAICSKFDAIIMAHVFEHVVHDVRAIRNCYQMLKPGGILVVISPGHKSGICTQKEVERNGHIRRMNLPYMRSLEMCNFSLAKYRSVHTVHNLVWNKLKYALKAAYYPMKLIDHMEMYDRPTYRRLSTLIMRILDKLDSPITRATASNILAVYHKHS